MPLDHTMKRQQQQVTDFFQRKSKCIENRDDSANDVNISDSECKYFCSEDKGAVLITHCKPDPASTSINNSKSDAANIRDRKSTYLCTEDTGAVLLSDSKSEVATADIIGTSSSPTVKSDPTFTVSGFSNWKKTSEKILYSENSESHKDSEEALLAFNQKPVSARLYTKVRKEMEKAESSDYNFKKRGEDLDSQPVSLRRVRNSPKRLEHNTNTSPPVQYSSPEQFLRQEYFAVIDRIKGEIESRFQHRGVAIYKVLENVLIKSSNGEVENIRDQVLQICEHFKGDLNVERFTRQLAMLAELTAGRKINSVRNVLDSIRREQPQTRRLFSEACPCSKLLLVLPATSETAEIRLKTWLRSTMTQERLDHIAVMAVHRDLVKDVSNLDIANKFISSKESRRLIFGHIHK
ncbi:hypothetical protein PR048_020370 [Dryococelus australis]|uniref:Vitellogenin n=1 Tax=Dryococelus australis TaxID=614101 RepID=A0ABQ9H680_9NEOP|nr:hypothetical protein PR048_020370 [Dryococelus australis]